MDTNQLSLLCNGMILILTTVIVIGDVLREKEKGRPGLTFRYFTTDSNIFSALTALLTLPWNLRAMETGTALALPEWLTVLKLLSASSVAVTFMVVMLFLGPTQGYKPMLTGTNAYMHVLGPILAALTFGLWEGPVRLSMLSILMALIPVVVYGTLYMYMVIVRGEEKGGWPDFYGFNRGGHWPLSAVGVAALCAIMAFLLILLHNGFAAA